MNWLPILAIVLVVACIGLGVFVVGCILGPGLEDAMRDRDWRGRQ